MTVSDIVSICSIIAAVASGISEPALETLFPGHGAYVAGILAVVGLAAGQIIRVLTNKTDAPAKSVIDFAPSVPAGTTVTTANTPVTGINTISPIPTAPPTKAS
jgi:hypothetical protein